MLACWRIAAPAAATSARLCGADSTLLTCAHSLLLGLRRGDGLPWQLSRSGDAGAAGRQGVAGSRCVRRRGRGLAPGVQARERCGGRLRSGVCRMRMRRR